MVYVLLCTLALVVCVLTHSLACRFVEVVFALALSVLLLPLVLAAAAALRVPPDRSHAALWCCVLARCSHILTLLLTCVDYDRFIHLSTLGIFAVLLCVVHSLSAV